jgi:hypothetical protein
MSTTLRASSAIRQFLLFDPSAIEHTRRHGRRPGPLEWARETRNGNAAWYMGPRRGEHAVVMRVYVDETPGPEILQRRERPVHGYLCVPDGQLFLMGVEDVLGLGPAGNARLEDGDDLLDTIEKMRLPPGDYAVEAFHLNWDDPPTAMPWFTVGRLTEALSWLLFLLMLGIPMLLLVKQFRWARTFSWVVVGGLVLSVCAMGAWEAGVKRQRGPLAWLYRRLARASGQFPDGVIVLTRLPAGARTALLRGCTFGPGAFPAPGFEVVMPSST